MHRSQSLNRLCAATVRLLIVSALTILAVSLSVSPSRACAEELSVQTTVTLKDVRQGSLLFKTAAPDQFLPAPTQQTDVSLRVTGPIVRATVTQQFINVTGTWQEGVYVFPLPEQAAVDHLRLRIGERVIEGVIKERAAAARTYARAKQEGKRAALVEQERPNIFTTSVANIGPGETVHVTIEYQETLKPDHETYRLRFPMVVGPRYVPGMALGDSQAVDHGGAALPNSGLGWGVNTDQVPDAERITPPVLLPWEAPVNPVRLSVDLAPGFPIDELRSPYHDVRTHRVDAETWQVRLADGTVPADRDFELVWRPALEQAQPPSTTAFLERQSDATYGLLLLTPPPAGEDSAPVTQAREVIFIIDTSGSMQGASLTQAQAALRLALARLSPKDSFNVIQFNSVAHRLFPQARTATPSTVSKAIDYVERLVADGGTEMLSALTLALDGGTHHDRLRQIVFLTDGQAGNEPELFRMIQERLGDSRLFTVGIGSAPNSYFMRHAAEFGRGTFTYIGKLEEVQDKMGALFRKLEHPLVTDLTIDQAGWEQAEFFPSTLPDLYAGEPLLLAVRAAAIPKTLVVTGRRGTQPWRAELALDPTRVRDGLGVFWARQKLGELSERFAQTADPDPLRQGMVDLALRHHLVSRFTSLVAVDVTPARPSGEAMLTKAVPTNLPQGQDYEHIFGLPQTATPAQQHLIVGGLLLLLALGMETWRRRQAV